MNYTIFIEILTPALQMLVRESKEYQAKFGKPLTLFNKATEAELEKFEAKNGISIPEFYRDFLRRHNPIRMEIMFHSFLGLEGLQKEVDDYQAEIVIAAGYLPIIVDNGDYFCIKEDDDKLYIADHDQGYEIAPFDSLSVFLRKLVEEKIGY